MTDREKLEKLLEFVKKKEDEFYKPIEDGKCEPGSLVQWSVCSRQHPFKQ